MSQDAQKILVERLVEMQNKYDAMENEKHKATKEMQRWKKRQQDSEHMAKELQFEKIRLIQELEEKQRHINKFSSTAADHRQQQLQQKYRKERPTRPLSVVLSSTATATTNNHSSDTTKPTGRRHSQLPSPKVTTATTRSPRLPSSPTTTDRPTPNKSTSSSSSARCRELEQMLADAKLKIVQLETNSAPSSPAADRPSFDRSDLQKRGSIYGRFWSALSSQQHDQQQQHSPPSSPITDTDSHSQSLV